jgi:TRAP-type transport system periplasmic protein
MFFVALAFAAILPAEATVFKIATVAPEGTAWMREMRAGAEAVKKRSEGRVEVKYYPGGVMGDNATVLRKIKIGQLQGGAFTGSELSQVDADAQIYSVPFTFHAVAEVDSLRAKLDPMMRASFEKNGFVLLGISGGGFAYLMSTHDIHGKDDMKSAKVWVPQGDHIAEIAFKAGGVSPIPLPLADVYTSLQTGLVDTVANTPAGAIAFQWHTKLKHMVDLPLTYIVGLLIVDKKIFDTVDAADQKILHEEFSAAFGRIETSARKDDVDARVALEKQGVAMFIPDAQERMAWSAIGDEAYQQLVAEKAFSPELQAALQKALDALRAARPGATK